MGRIKFCELQVVSRELSMASWFLLMFCEWRVACFELVLLIFASCELQVGFPSYQFILFFRSNFRY